MSQCVVVIDDERDVLDVVCEVLEMENFTVICLDRPELLEVSVGARHPDLFLIDIMLHGQSGVEVAEDLRRRGYATTPMLAMSASRLMSHFASQSGVFQDAIDKPFDIAALVECVRRYAAQSQTTL